MTGRAVHLETLARDVEVDPARAASLLVVALDAAGRREATVAEAHPRQALRDDPGYQPAARELVRFEIDRGASTRPSGSWTRLVPHSRRSSVRTAAQHSSSSDAADVGSDLECIPVSVVRGWNTVIDVCSMRSLDRRPGRTPAEERVTLTVDRSRPLPRGC